MTQLSDGPLHPQYGPYVRNAIPIGNGFFLVDVQRGTKGTGKTWRAGVVGPHPADPARFYHCGIVKPSTKQWSPPFEAATWIYDSDNPERARRVTGAFPTAASAVAFMVRMAPDLRTI